MFNEFFSKPFLITCDITVFHQRLINTSIIFFNPFDSNLILEPNGTAVRWVVVKGKLEPFAFNVFVIDGAEVLFDSGGGDFDFRYPVNQEFIQMSIIDK